MIIKTQLMLLILCLLVRRYLCKGLKSKEGTLRSLADVTYSEKKRLTHKVSAVSQS